MMKTRGATLGAAGRGFTDGDAHPHFHTLNSGIVLVPLHCQLFLLYKEGHAGSLLSLTTCAKPHIDWRWQRLNPVNNDFMQIVPLGEEPFVHTLFGVG